MLKTCFNRTKGDFEIAWPGKVARHDLVYKAPPADPMQYGMPLGNGDIGALVWCEDRKLIIAVNKCDLWDDAPFGPFTNWSREQDESTTTLRHACRIIIDFGMPVFDTFYLNDFDGRLRMKDGCAELSLTGPFGSLKAEIFVTYEGSVICAKITTDFVEDDGVEVTLERYGSRTYSGWYARVRRDPSIGLMGTESWAEEDCLMVSHEMRSGKFVCALKPEGEGIVCGRRTSHMVSAKAEKCPKEFVFFATVTSPFEEDPSAEYAKKVLDAAKDKGFDQLLAENENCWKAFWEKSFIETDDDYLDNLWHLVMYYSCAGQKGRYPGRFINSLWNWNRDVQPWNSYFHWNQQEAYWGLNAAGHHELCESYLNYRFNGMEHSRETAENLFGVKDGLFVSDVCERRGYNSDGEKHNHTPVGEIALDFWRQYQYTKDEVFLREKALPYMLGAAKFFATLFDKEEDGLYHARSGNGYEGSTIIHDVITELTMANVLFTATLEAMKIAGVTDEDAPKFKEILAHLAPIQLLDSDPRMIAANPDGTGTLLRGMFKGETVPSSKVVAIGMPTEANRGDARIEPLIGRYVPQYGPVVVPEGGGAVITPDGLVDLSDEVKMMDGVDIVRGMMHEHTIPTNVIPQVERSVSAHPQANTAPVFPMGMVGVKDKGTDLYNALVATAKVSREVQAMGWDPMPIVLARLGLADEVDAYIYDYPSIWQYYNNGFGHYGPNSVFVADMNSPFRRDKVRDLKTNEIYWAETFPFRHMGLEPLGVFSAVMNERLLQSHDGVIRIAPAYGKKDARFKLHAVGAFVVSCEVKDGVPAFVAIKSTKGGKLRMENPWKSAFCEGREYSAGIIEMDTEAGKTYLFTPDGHEEFDFEPALPAANDNYKVRPDGNAMLGLMRSF